MWIFCFRAMMVYSVGNITECVGSGRNEARLVAQGLRLVHCDLSGLLEAEGPEDRAVPNQDLVTVPSGLEAHDGASERSEERRVGKECVSTCRSGWSPVN